MHLKYWSTRAKFNKIITAIEINPIDIDLLFGYFDKFAKSLKIPPREKLDKHGQPSPKTIDFTSQVIARSRASNQFFHENWCL